MRNKTRNILVIAVCLIAVIGGLPVFASGSCEYENTENVLWYQAAEIVEENASVLPVSKTVIWDELGAAGKVLNSEEITVFYSETEGSVFLAEEGETGKFIDGKELQIYVTGDLDAFVKRSMVNDGLFWTPFDDDVDDEDVTVSNTGRVEIIDGTECSVFNYTLYRDAAQCGYDFEETVRDNRDLIEDFDDPESTSIIKVEGSAWIDGCGILRQLESNVDYNGADYNEVIKYEFDGSTLFPVESFLKGTLETTAGDLIVKTDFSATELMKGFWTAADFYR